MNYTLYKFGNTKHSAQSAFCFLSGVTMPWQKLQIHWHWLE